MACIPRFVSVKEAVPIGVLGRSNAKHAWIQRIVTENEFVHVDHAVAVKIIAVIIHSVTCISPPWAHKGQNRNVIRHNIVKKNAYRFCMSSPLRMISVYSKNPIYEKLWNPRKRTANSTVWVDSHNYLVFTTSTEGPFSFPIPLPIRYVFVNILICPTCFRACICIRGEDDFPVGVYGGIDFLPGILRFFDELERVVPFHDPNGVGDHWRFRTWPIILSIRTQQDPAKHALRGRATWG